MCSGPPTFCQIAPFDVSTAGRTQWALYPQPHTVVQCEEKVRLSIWRVRGDDVHKAIRCIQYTEPFPFFSKRGFSLCRFLLTFVSSHHPILDDKCFSVTFIEVFTKFFCLFFRLWMSVFFSWWAETPLKSGSWDVLPEPYLEECYSMDRLLKDKVKLDYSA